MGTMAAVFSRKSSVTHVQILNYAATPEIAIGIGIESVMYESTKNDFDPDPDSDPDLSERAGGHYRNGVH